MADISICLNDKCKFRGDCGRYLAVPNEPKQSYFFHNPAASHCGMKRDVAGPLRTVEEADAAIRKMWHEDSER